MSEATENLLIPAEFYFQASLKCAYQSDLQEKIRQGKHPAGLTELPDLSFQTPSPKQPRFFVGWNDEGLAIALQWPGKKQLEPPKSKLQPESGDLCDFYLDTRDLKSNSRTNRFCHGFRLQAGDRKSNDSCEIVRKVLSYDYGNVPQEEDVEIPSCTTASSADGLQITFWLAKENLFGYDPENVPSLGFYYHLSGKSQQDYFFGPGPGFPYYSNPSLWPSLKLSR